MTEVQTRLTNNEIMQEVIRAANDELLDLSEIRINNQFVMWIYPDNNGGGSVPEYIFSYPKNAFYHHIRMTMKEHTS